MFANYRYSAVLRRVTPSSAANPKNDPILIGELQGVSGLEDDEVEKGWFGDSAEMGFFITSEGRYESKTLIFDGDPWTGAGELVSTPIDRSYSNNVDGTFIEPSRIEGIKNSFKITNNRNESGNIVDLYTTHIENAIGKLKAKGTFNIGVDSKTLSEGKVEDNSVLIYKNTLNNDFDTKSVQLLNLGTKATLNLFTDVLTSKRVVLGAGNTTTEIPINFSDKLADNSNDTSLSDYATLTYKQIYHKSDKTSDAHWTGDFRKKLKPRPQSNYTIRNVYGNPVTDDIDNIRSVSSKDPNKQEDFINMSIYSITTGDTIRFTTFLTSFSDTISPSFNDIKYVGRQDTLKYFSGVTRTTSIGFKLAAFNPMDLSYMYGKLYNLIKGGAVGSIAPGQKTISAPVCNLTFGNWFYKTPCVITSMKFDIQTSDYAWDIDEGMPQLVDVSLDFFILGDVTGNALNSTSNRYFGYL